MYQYHQCLACTVDFSVPSCNCFPNRGLLLTRIWTGMIHNYSNTCPYPTGNQQPRVWETIARLWKITVTNWMLQLPGQFSSSNRLSLPSHRHHWMAYGVTADYAILQQFPGWHIVVVYRTSICILGNDCPAAEWFLTEYMWCNHNLWWCMVCIVIVRMRNLEITACAIIVHSHINFIANYCMWKCDTEVLGNDPILVAQGG